MEEKVDREKILQTLDEIDIYMLNNINIKNNTFFNKNDINVRMRKY